jgi:hypothetical protein
VPACHGIAAEPGWRINRLIRLLPTGCGPVCDGQGLPRPEAVADAGPAVPQAPP